MTLTRTRYAPAFQELHRELNRLLEGEADRQESSRSNWTPRTDILEHDDRYELKLDLPGVARKDVEISFEGETLEISGERRQETGREGRTYYKCECATGPFSRKFRFPTLISVSGIGAQLESGVLTVTVPKAEEAKARTIEIK